ncbi:PAAR/S-type pyocin domain-containing protein [Yersinia frederiksenii]|nr:PAAR/S-type pyocin domain-containing protein [Yersinia frederiksenii]
MKEFGREVVKQCLTGGDCPALLAIQAMMGEGENGPSDTGGDQIAGSGLTNTGGDQTAGNSLNHTGGGNTTGQGATDTGNRDGKPDTGGDSTVTPIPEGLSQDDIAYISKIWSDKKNTTSVENAYGHWQKHGAEFPEYKNAKQYVEAAHNFVTNPPDGTLTKTRPNGDTVYYNPSSNTFGIKMSDGSPRTMFKPDAGMDYWNKQ